MRNSISLDLLSNGFSTIQFQNPWMIEALNTTLLRQLKKTLGKELESLADVHQVLTAKELNGVRLSAIQLINQDMEFRRALLDDVAQKLECLLGPDIAVQRDFNLVISMPGDRCSQIPLHADTWSGNSSFELNLWIPLTRVWGSQSMFLLPLPAWKEKQKQWDGKSGTTQELMSAWGSDLLFVELEPSQALIFWNHLPHGNIVNTENKTRWSLNLRFKNLFSPYGEKGLGDYFLPWKYSAVTEMVLRERQ